MPNVSVGFLKNFNISEVDIRTHQLNEKLTINDQLTKPDILFKKHE